jgi:hypothetical protein
MDSFSWFWESWRSLVINRWTFRFPGTAEHLLQTAGYEPLTAPRQLTANCWVTAKCRQGRVNRRPVDGCWQSSQGILLQNDSFCTPNALHCNFFSGRSAHLKGSGINFGLRRNGAGWFFFIGESSEGSGSRHRVTK